VVNEPFVPGAVFAGYVVERIAGRGGMGVVYRAREQPLDRTIALKVIAPAFARDPAFRARFERESRIAAQIEHPNVVPVYGAGEHEGQLFLAMRFLDGTDLASVLDERGRIAPVEAAELIAQVARALDAAHSRGLVHRDVKPANIMVSPGDPPRAFLTDFGLSVEGDARTGLTRTGQFVGTVAYIAPEQIRGLRVDARTDVYALGGVLHHLLTGQVPYPRDSEASMLVAHLSEPPPRPGALVKGVPSALDAVVTRAMSKEPGQRHPSAGDLGRAAAAAVRGHRLPAPRGSVATGPAAPGADGLASRATARRRPAAAWAAGAMATLGAVAIAIAVLSTDGQQTSGDGSANAAGRLTGRPLAIRQPPDKLAVLGRTLWAITLNGGALTRIDTQRRRVREFRAPVDLGGGGYPGIAAGFGSLWIAHDVPALGGIDRVNPTDGRAAARVTLPHAVAVAVGAERVWAASAPAAGARPRQGALVQIDPDTNRAVGRRVALGPDPVDVKVGPAAVWVADAQRDSVTRIDPRTSRVVARIGVGDRPQALAVDRDAVWVANLGDRTLTRIDPASNMPRGAPIRLGKEIEGLALGAGALWVASADGTVTRLDPADGRTVGSPIAAGRPPLAIVADRGGVWVASVAGLRVRRIVAA
jgi:YVTN family beta-propeller protein